MWRFVLIGISILGGCRAHFDQLEGGVDGGLPGPGVVVTLMGDGQGRIVSSPRGIDCPTTCAAEFAPATVVTLTHISEPGSIFASWGGVCPGGASCQVTVTGAEQVLAQFLLPRNYVFTTATTVVPGSLGSVAAGDSECMARAAAVGLPGMYRAWLSSTTMNARDRFASARGWLRLDNKPFADTVDDIVAGNINYPVGYYDTGVAPPAGTEVVTGSSQGLLAENCTDFTSAAQQYAASRPNVMSSFFDRSDTPSCTTPAHLYCFGIDYQRPVEPVPAVGRFAFLTATDWHVSGGFAGADAFCQAEADAAGLTGTFGALLAGTTANAASRFDTAGPTWVRADGLPLAVKATDVMAGSIDTVINVAADKSRATGEVWTGSILQPPNGAASNTYTCADWTDTVGTEQGASTINLYTGPQFFGASGAITCTQPGRRLYCLAR